MPSAPEGNQRTSAYSAGRMIVSESNVVVMTGDHRAWRRIQIGPIPGVMDRCFAFRGRFERQIQLAKGGG